MAQASQKTPDSLRSLQRWIARVGGHAPDIPKVLEWFEQSFWALEKQQFSGLLVREVARHGTPDDLQRMADLGYDLKKACTYQVDGHALHAAAQYGKRANVLALVGMGMALDERIHPNGHSALDEMLINGHLKLFNECLSIHQANTAPLTDQDKARFLLAAVSAKTRKEHNLDLDKRRTTRFALRQFGPFPQDILTKALHEVAQQGWVETFDVLVEAGAPADHPVPLFLTSMAGEGTLVMELLAHASPADWGYVLESYPSHPKWFFPDPREDGTARLTVEQVLSNMPGSNANAYLDLAKHAIQSIKITLHRNELNKKLAEGDAVARRPVRF